MLGGSLIGQKKYTEAETLLLAGYTGMKERESSIPPIARIRLNDALERLVILYEALQNPDEAAKWKAQLDQIPTTKEKQDEETSESSGDQE